MHPCAQRFNNRGGESGEGFSNWPTSSVMTIDQIAEDQRNE
jgi:hypothetical protein